MYYIGYRFTYWKNLNTGTGIRTLAAASLNMPTNDACDRALHWHRALNIDSLSFNFD